MTRKAIVASIGESWINLLSLDEVEKAYDETCGTSHCGSSGCGCRVSGLPFRAAVPKRITVKTGDTVEVSASGIRALGASLLVFGVPTVGALAGWFGVTRLFPAATEGIAAIGTVLGLILAGSLICIPTFKRNSRLPEITSVVK